MHVQENDYEELAGDPDHLQTMAAHYLGIADKIRKSVPFLQSLSDGDGQKSKATDKLKDEAGKVADDIAKAESRYRVTAQALSDYVPAMRSAKDDAHTAVLKIKEAQGDVTTTGTTLDKATTAASTAPDSGKDDADTAKTKAKTASDAAKKDLAHWQSKWRDARDARNTAAHTARNKINDLIQHHNNGLKNPEHHWYDSITSFVSHAWHDIKEIAKGALSVLKVICKIAGFLSIFLSWVPILGEVLIGLSILGAAITLIEDIASGKGWKTILGDSIGLALTAFGGGVGKYLSKLSKFKRFSAMEKFVADGGSKKGFSAAFGVSKRAFTKGLAKNQLARRGVVDLDNSTINAMKTSKLKSFVNDVKNPFANDYDRTKSYMYNLKGAYGDAKGNPLGLISKGMMGGKSGLSIPMKATLAAYDLRSGLQTAPVLINGLNDMGHGDFYQDGNRNYQVKDYSPDGYALGKLSGS